MKEACTENPASLIVTNIKNTNSAPICSDIFMCLGKHFVVSNFSSPHIMGSFTVLTEPSSTRGGRVDEPPPPPAPRGNSKSSRSGGGLQDSKHGHWKRYTDSPGVGSPPPPPPPAPSSPPSSRRERRNSPHGSSSGGSKEKGTKVKGVPQSFGYIKRNSSGTNGTCVTNGTSIPISS